MPRGMGPRGPRPHRDPLRPQRRIEIKVHLLPETVALINGECERAAMSRSAWIEAIIFDALYGPQDGDGGSQP